MLRRIWIALLLSFLGACSSIPTADRHEASPATDPGASLAAADSTRADGRLTEAVQLYQQVLVANPNSVAAQFGMAESLLGLGRPFDARPIFAALTKNSQFRAVALQGAGIADIAMKKYDDAGKELRDAVAADADLWRAYNALGFIADQQRRFGDAADLYAKALAANPDSATLLNNRGYSLLIAGKTDEAIADLRKALVLDPQSETVQNNFRLAMAEKGDYAEATRSIPRDKQAVILNNIGVVAMRRGDLGAAEGMLARAMAGNPNYDAVTARNLDHLASLKESAK
jgi:Flp pilus assembly protein TadD